MRSLKKLTLVPVVVGVALALIALAMNAGARAQAQEGVASMGIDAKPDGNSATALGARDVCVAVRSGDTFQIDLTIDGVASLVAWEAYLSLDREVVHVVDRDSRQFVASSPDSQVIDLSDSVPYDDSDPEVAYRVGGSDISTPPVGVDGTGVLARITLEAQGAGVTTLSVAPVPTTAGRPVGPVLRDKDGELIADADDDGLFDGPFLDAQVAVDQACPGEEGPGLTDVAGGDGTSLWIFLVLAVVVVAAAGFAGVALIVLRRTGSHPAS